MATYLNGGAKVPRVSSELRVTVLGAGYPGSGPLELLLLVFELVAQRLLFLLQLCQTLLQLESQRGVDASGDVLVTGGEKRPSELTNDCRASGS